jgi:hypothetical protein
MLECEEAVRLKLIVVQAELVVVGGFVFDLEQLQQGHVETVTHALQGCLGEALQRMCNCYIVVRVCK